MNRRDFLRGLFGAATLTAAGLAVPARKTYSFVLDNPLARDDHARHLALHKAWMAGGASAFERCMIDAMDTYDDVPGDPNTDANRVLR
jgi:hypothetical protein